MIILVRHGQCVWNLEGRRHGLLDSPLTPLGEQQARLIGRRLVSLRDPERKIRVVSSPLLRARRTAELVAAPLGIERVEFEPRLRELNFSAWQGLTDNEVRERFPDQWRERVKDKWHYVLPGGESYAQGTRRVAEWADGLDDHEVVIAIAHQGIGRAIRAHLLDLDPRVALGLSQPNHVFYLLSDKSCVPMSVRDVGQMCTPAPTPLSERRAFPSSRLSDRERLSSTFPGESAGAALA